ncbi:MAG: hypothetical protein ACWA6X_09030 [Bauldia sp.]
MLWKGWPDGTTTGSSGTPWTYDNAGLLYGIPSLITSTTYNAVGQVTHIAYANSVETQNTYDAVRSWLMVVNTSRLGTTLQSVTYTRDAAGRALTRVVSPNTESWTYTYDGIDRLLSAANATTPANSRTFTYDAAGKQPDVHLRRRRQHAHQLRRGHLHLPDRREPAAARGADRGGEHLHLRRRRQHAHRRRPPAEGVHTRIPDPDARIIRSIWCWVHRDDLASISVRDGRIHAFRLAP